MATVSVLITTLNAMEWLPKQLAALHRQTVPIAEIVLMDSQSEDGTCLLAKNDPLCRVISIRRTDFDHGGTRDDAARTCASDYLWFLTQDAIPKDEHCLEELLKAVQGKDVACAYSRQVADPKASRIEQLNRLANYPTESFSRGEDDIKDHQIRTFFLSNTSCLYKRELYERVGGFRHDLPTNEDMLIAATFIHHGYRTAYCATSEVWHAHHATLLQWYRRSFDTGAFMHMFATTLAGARANAAGMKYMLSVMKTLAKELRLFSACYFGMICVTRWLGDRDGRHYTRLSDQAILRRTQNPAFWLLYLNASSAVHE